MAHQGAASLRPVGMCLQSSGSWVLYWRKSSFQPSLSAPRIKITGFSTLEQEMASPGDPVAGAAAACPESWCTLRSLQTSVSAIRPSTLQAHKDAYATKPAIAQTAAAHCAAAVDITSWNRHAASAAIVGSTGAAMCCVRSVVSPSGSTCASRLKLSHSGLPLPIQDSRWRACLFAHSCGFVLLLV